jgi:DUF917 family protein
MRVISPEKLKNSDICVFSSWYGAPSVSGERIPAGTELSTAVANSIKIANHDHFEAVVANEIGGGNGMATFPTAVSYDIPVVDCDLMGRAYPTMEHGMKDKGIIEKSLLSSCHARHPIRLWLSDYTLHYGRLKG